MQKRVAPYVSNSFRIRQQCSFESSLDKMISAYVLYVIKESPVFNIYLFEVSKTNIQWYRPASRITFHKQVVYSPQIGSTTVFRCLDFCLTSKRYV